MLVQNSKVNGRYCPDLFKNPSPGKTKEGKPGAFGVITVLFEEPKTRGIPKFLAHKEVSFGVVM